MRVPEVLPYLTDCYVLITDVVDGTDGTPVPNADVKVTLFDREGAPIDNATDLLAAYDTPNNLYRATIPDDAHVTLGISYRACVALTMGSLTSRIWRDVIVERYTGE